MKHIITLLAVFVLFGCASHQFTPGPYYGTHVPDYAATHDAEGPDYLATSDALEYRATAEASKCVDYRQAPNYVGQTICVQGIVSWAGINKGTYFIDFGNTYTDCYAVSFDYTFRVSIGDCVEISGLIETYKGRPEIIIRNPNQVSFCQ